MNSMDREGGLLGLFRNKAVLACLTALCLACGGCASQPEDISPLDADGLIVLTIGTADTGGTMTPVGTAIAQVLSTDQLKFNISTSTGSFMNIQNLSSGEIDLGLVAGDSAYTAVYGTEDSAPTNEDLRAVAAVFSSTSNWMSPIRTGAFYVHDLKGMRIGAGPQGSASELATWAVINALRLDGDGTVLENCSLGAGTDLILSGDLDAIHGFTGAPVSGLAQLPERVPSHPGGAGSDPLPERPLLPRRHPRRHLPRAVPGCRHLWGQVPAVCRRLHGRGAGLLHDPGPVGVCRYHGGTVSRHVCPVRPGFSV